MIIDPTEIWLSKVDKRHSGSNGTAQVYRRVLRRFCRFMDTSPVQIVEGWKAAKYDLEGREQFIDDILEKVDVYENHLGKKGLSRNTISLHLSSIQSFFKYMRIPVKLEVFTAKSAFHNRDITKDEINRILNNSTPRDKSFYLMMVQSGLRPMTLMQLTYTQIKTDFEADRVPCLIKVPRNMTKGEYAKHFTFVGSDAVKALKGYFEERKMPKDSERIYIGVKTPNAFSMRFGYYVRTLGLIKQEDMRPTRKPQQLRLYCLRKYFRKMAAPAGPDFVNFWMGHSLGVDEHYFSRDPEYHRKQYEEKAMPNLQIFEPSALDVSVQLREIAKENKDLRNRLASRDVEVAELRRRIESLGGVKRLAEVLERSKSLEEAFTRFKRLKDKEFETS